MKSLKTAAGVLLLILALYLQDYKVHKFGRDELYIGKEKIPRLNVVPMLQFLVGELPLKSSAFNVIISEVPTPLFGELLNYLTKF